MASEPAGVFDIQGGQKCFFFPVDDKGDLLAGADDMFSADVTKPLQLPKLAKHIQGNEYERAFVLCHGWNNDPETASMLCEQRGVAAQRDCSFANRHSTCTSG